MSLQFYAVTLRNSIGTVPGVYKSSTPEQLVVWCVLYNVCCFDENKSGCIVLQSMCCRSWSTETTTHTLETVECGPWARDCVPHTHTHSQTCTHTHRSHACTHTHHTHWHAIEPFQLELCTKFLRFRGSIAIHLTRALSVCGSAMQD